MITRLLQPQREISKNPPDGQFGEMTTAAPHPKSRAYQPEETTCVKRCNGFLRRHRPTHTRPSAFYVAQAFHLWSQPLSGHRPPAGLLAPWWTHAHQHLSSRPTERLVGLLYSCAMLVPAMSSALRNTASCDTPRELSSAGESQRAQSMRPAVIREQNTVMSSLAPALQGNYGIHDGVIFKRIPHLEIKTWPITIHPLLRPPRRRAILATNPARATKPIFTPHQPPHHPRNAATLRWPSLSAVLLSGWSFCISCSTGLAATIQRQRPVHPSITHPASQSNRARQLQKPHQHQSQSQRRSNLLPRMTLARQHLNLRPLTDTDSYDHIDNPTKAGRSTTPGFDVSRMLSGPRKAQPC